GPHSGIIWSPAPGGPRTRAWSTMKRWGSQVQAVFFSSSLLGLLRQQREASRGSRGTAMSPPVAARGGEIGGTDAGLADHGQRRVGDALDYSSCGTPGGEPSCRPSTLNTPRRPFVRTTFGDNELSLRFDKAAG